MMVVKKNNDLADIGAAVPQTGKHMGSGALPLSPALAAPVPALSNRLRRSGLRHVFHRPEYVAWQKEAGWTLKA
jgi:hypothetical protein